MRSDARLHGMERAATQDIRAGMPAKPAEDRSAPEDVPGGPMPPRVLLAEDNRDMREIFARQLSLMGLEVVGVGNGRHAADIGLAALRAGNPFDMILMDLEMPLVDGYEATRQLREGGYAGPILALSAHSTDEHLQDCLLVGCNDCLSKPIPWDHLALLVRKYLPHHPPPALTLTPVG
ncbi:response regulator [Aquisphaera insulae]|uniref:response regulator n=1 Tax=Aquisphaera insulae TaxID=2712864 RepID=UPI0013EC2E30|nr:response regulator [Aquisphaera insulae]